MGDGWAHDKNQKLFIIGIIGGAGAAQRDWAEPSIGIYCRRIRARDKPMGNIYHCIQHTQILQWDPLWWVKSVVHGLVALFINVLCLQKLIHGELQCCTMILPDCLRTTRRCLSSPPYECWFQLYVKDSYNIFVQCMEPSIFCLPGEQLGLHKYRPQTRNCQLSFHFYHRKMSMKVLLLLCLTSLSFGLPNPFPQGVLECSGCRHHSFKSIV